MKKKIKFFFLFSFHFPPHITPSFEHVAKCEVTDEEVVKICRLYLACRNFQS